MKIEAFLAITVTLIIFILFVLIYLISVLVRIKRIKNQIKVHKDKKLDSTYLMSLSPLILLDTSSMIGIDFLLAILLAGLITVSVILTEKLESYNKELLEIIKEENR